MKLDIRVSAGRPVRRGLSALAFGAAVAWAASAAADNPVVCFPPPVGVPGLFGAPAWFADPNAPGTAVRTDLNEPRWSGAPLLTFPGDNGNPQTGEGGLHFILDPDGTELSVSFQNFADNTPKGGGDEIWFGIAANGGKGGVIHEPVTWNGTTDPYVYTGGEGAYWTLGSAGWSGETDAYPPFLTAGSLGAWTNSPVSSGGADWAVQFKVNLTALGINATSGLTIYAAMTKTDGMGKPVFVSVPQLVTPAPAVIKDTVVPSDQVNQWFAVPSIKQGCPAGVGFTSNLQIGGNNDPTNTVINTTAGATNSFFANPVVPANVTAPPSGALQARFRIADWGAQVGDPDAGWVTIPDGGAVTSVTGALGGGVSFNFSCPANAGGKVCGLPPPTIPHQCMLVQLSNAPLHNSPIGTASVFRNMSFESLSTKTLPAVISVKGLQARLGNSNPRDVYIDVVTRNMPALGNLPIILDSLLLNLLKSAAIGLVQALNPLADSLTTDQQLKLAWPTYEVHVYYDTGRSFLIHGKTISVLTTMNSFGYYFSHDGSLFGFTTGLGGVAGGASVGQLGPAQYHVRVPNEGNVQIQTGVSAEEMPLALTPPGDRTCQLFPFAPECN
jgi:hypothetical protein